ncbi:MAG: DNA-directed DNA polymerase [Candidatus Micrarchaeia archaeon]|jgi:DNA polymerase I
MKISGFLLSINYAPENESITLWIKTDSGIKKITDTYDPYFYLDAPEYIIKDIELLKIGYKNEPIQIKKYEKVKKALNGKEKELFKIYCYSPSHIPLIKKALQDFQCYEYKIRFIQRYMIDKNLWPLNKYELEYNGNTIEKITDLEEEENFNLLAFDIETYNPIGIPREKKDPVIMISYADDKEAKVLTYKKVERDFILKYKNETEMIEGFCEILEKKDIDLILGYNTNLFDFPYLRKRSRNLGIDLTLGRENQEIIIKKDNKIEIPGRISIDLYPVARFLSNIGAVRITRYTLKRVYHELIGEKSETKELVEKEDIWKMWEDDEQRNILADYSLGDSKAVIEISKHLLPVEVELSKICGLSLDETTNSATGRLVESLLMRYAQKRNEIIPEVPSFQEVKQRQMNPIKAAYVKIPEPGIYENIVVFDFRSLYPSIIISHNIDPFTINCECCTEKEANISPLGHKFCKKRKGIIPEALEDLIKKRNTLKNEMKNFEKNSDEYNKLFARQWALKILANSFYGQTVYPRARWYSRECGSSITAWGRYYILSTIEKAEKQGFDVLYSDTDSVLLTLKEKTKEDAINFMKNINKELPGDMELELEDFYPRGLFVTKRTSTTGAKKKYALIDEKGMIKIRGFELVRRDWSKIAKRTQMNILKAILQEGNKEKAVKIVKDTIQNLKEGKVDLEDLVIFTQLQKSLNSYAITSPELSAAKKAIARGKKIEKGTLIGYIITKKGNSISDKAELLEFAEDYDADYYINKQILPSVLKILKELGYSEEDLKFKGKQIGLGNFM